MENQDAYITALIDLFLEHYTSLDVCKYLCKKIQNKRLLRKYKRIIAACFNKCIINNMHEIFKTESKDYLLWFPFSRETYRENDRLVNTNYVHFLHFSRVCSEFTKYSNKYFLYKYLDSIIHDYYYAELEDISIIDTFCKRIVEYISDPLFIPGSDKNFSHEIHTELDIICNNYHKHPTFLHFIYEAFPLPKVFYSKESIIYNEIIIDDEYHRHCGYGFYDGYTRINKFQYYTSFIIYFLRVLNTTLHTFFLNCDYEENEILVMTHDARMCIKNKGISAIQKRLSKHNFIYNKKLSNTQQKIKIVEYHKKYVLMLQSVWMGELGAPPNP